MDIAFGTWSLDDGHHAFRVNVYPLWPLDALCGHSAEEDELAEGIGRICVPCADLVIPPGGPVERRFDHRS